MTSGDEPSAVTDRPGDLGPVTPANREPVLDLVRGFALLGILLINIEYMRGADVYLTFIGQHPAAEGADRITQFATGWLAAGKFIASFALLFGLGAAMMIERASGAGHGPRRLLARRYVWLLPIGLAHMTLLFAGDILFLYGLTGLVLLAFVRVRARTAMRWAVGLVAGMTLLFVAGTAAITLTPAPPDDAPAVVAMQEAVTAQRQQAVAAYTEGSYLDVVAVQATQAAFVQTSQLIMLPWVLALFLVGFAVTRSGIVADLAGHRRTLRRAAAVGLGVGLPLNMLIGILGPMWGGATFQQGADQPGLLITVAGAQMLGAPLLAVGYLATVALLGLRFGAWRPLAATGRMALSAYLAQSLMATIVFAGFGLYDQLSSTQALAVVVGIWAVLLVVCPIWLRRFRYGPVEWLWRRLTYGTAPSMRMSADANAAP